MELYQHLEQTIYPLVKLWVTFFLSGGKDTTQGEGHYALIINPTNFKKMYLLYLVCYDHDWPIEEFNYLELFVSTPNA